MILEINFLTDAKNDKIPTSEISNVIMRLYYVPRKGIFFIGSKKISKAFL